MTKRFKVWWLKRRAKSTYLAYRNHLDGYSCGSAMMQEISVHGSRLAVNFNKTMDKLASLDSNTPAGRL